MAEGGLELVDRLMVVKEGGLLKQRDPVKDGEQENLVDLLETWKMSRWLKGQKQSKRMQMFLLMLFVSYVKKHKIKS